MKPTLFFIAVLSICTACNSHRDPGLAFNLESNVRSARSIAAAARLHAIDNDEYPKSLAEIVSLGLLLEEPRCKCADGKERSFLYISGYSIIDADTSVLAVSPPEMHPEFGLVVQLNGTVRITSPESAQNAKARAEDYLESEKASR